MDLSVHVVRIGTTYPITICSVCLRLPQEFTDSDLTTPSDPDLTLLPQLSLPYVLLGNFNTHNCNLDSPKTDTRGSIRQMFVN